jgi:hypothetical protein
MIIYGVLYRWPVRNQWDFPSSESAWWPLDVVVVDPAPEARLGGRHEARRESPRRTGRLSGAIARWVFGWSFWGVFWHLGGFPIVSIMCFFPWFSFWILSSKGIVGWCWLELPVFEWFWMLFWAFHDMFTMSSWICSWNFVNHGDSQPLISSSYERCWMRIILSGQIKNNDRIHQRLHVKSPS